MPSSLLELPPELLLDVAGKLTTLSDLSSLVSTCRSAQTVLTPLLYSLAAHHHTYLLSWACETSNIGLARRLLEAGVSPNLPCHYSLGRACPDDEASPAEVLTKYYNHYKHLHRYSTAQELKTHLQTRQGVETLNVEKTTEKWPGTEEYYPSTEEYQRDQWANATSSGQGGQWYPLHSAAAMGDTDTIDLLLQYGAKLDVKATLFCECKPTWRGTYGLERSLSSNGNLVHGTPLWTPLHVSLCNEQDSAARTLINAGSDIIFNHAAPNREAFTTALHYAAAHGLLSIMDLLESRGDLNVDARDSCQWTPSLYAIEGPHWSKSLSWLLEHGADINADLGEGCNLLHIACLRADTQVAARLIDQSAAINTPWRHMICFEDMYARPLDVCCYMTSSQETNRWREYPTSRTNWDGEEALLERGKIIKKLIQAGANIEKCPGARFSPIEMACQHETPVILSAFHQTGATFDTQPTVIPHALWPTMHQHPFGTIDCCPTRMPGWNPLPCLNWLLSHGAPISNGDDDGILLVSLIMCLSSLPAGRPPLRQDRQVLVLETLLDHGLDPNLSSANPNPYPPLPRLSSASALSAHDLHQLLEKGWAEGAPLIRFLWEQNSLRACHKLIERGAKSDFGAGDIFGEAVAEIPRGLADPRAHAGMGLGNDDAFREFDSSRWSWGGG